IVSSMAEDDWGCWASAANGKAAAPPTSVMNSRRFIASSSPLARERNLADFSGQDIMAAQRALRRRHIPRRKTCAASLPTRDAQFYWDQAHVGFSGALCHAEQSGRTLSNEAPFVPTARYVRRRRAERLYLAEFLAQMGDTKMAASCVLVVMRWICAFAG